jgi:F-type H+-transporting ATPase subunit b
MQETLRQIGELLLNSIPTILSLLVVWMAYLFLVHKPLHQALAKRHALTEGAVEQARKEIAGAEARTAEYEQKVREARAQIFKTQESYRKHVMEERANALAEARKQADQMVKSARQTVLQEVEAAKAGLDKQADALADQVIQTVLRPGAAGMGSR